MTTRFSKIKWGDGLTVTDEGSGVIRVDGSTGTTVDISGKVDRDAVETATARLVQVKLAAADTQPAFRILGDGKHQWGPGGTSAPDTTLRRNGVNDLRTDGVFRAFSQIVASDGASEYMVMGAAGPAAEAGFDIAGDTKLYRPAGGTLRTDGDFTAKRVAARTGLDIGATGGVLTITHGIHRVSSVSGNISTINGGFDGMMLTLQNRTGATINFVSGGNINMTTSPQACAWGAARMFVFNLYDAAWQIIG